MKKLIAILCVMITANIIHASDFVTWKYGTADVYVSAYWWTQFPDRDDSQGKHLCIAVPKALYDSWGAAKKTAIKGALAKLVSGQVRVTRANLATWAAALTSHGIPTELVLPNDTPTVGPKIYFIVAAKDQTAHDALTRLGLKEKEQPTGATQ